jgi:cation diffusion facilitator family transporter
MYLTHPHPNHHEPDHPHEHHRGRLRSVLDGLFGHGHDHAEATDAQLEASAEGVRAVRLSLIALLTTAGLQTVVVLLSSSVALLADTIHNFADALTSVPLWIAFVVGRRVPTQRYTFGYRRAEDLAGLFVVLMIAASAALAAYESIRRLVDPMPVSNLGLVAVAGVIGLAGNELVAIYRIRVGERIGSAALVADGHHARTDGLTSLGVVLAAIGVALGIPLADPIVGLLITVAILFVLRTAAGQVFGRLMDAVDPEIVEEVEAVARAVKGVESVDTVRVRWIGHRLEANLHIEVDRERTVAEGHAIAEEVRHRLFHEVDRLVGVLTHVDPCAHDGSAPHQATAHHEAPAAR